MTTPPRLINNRLSVIAGSILAFCFITSCHQVSADPYSDAECPPGVSRPSSNEVRLCGSITPSMIDKAIGELDENTRIVTITSTGGSGVDAIRLAEAMQARDVTLAVQGICASACAHFLFLPAHHAVVHADSVVLFHHTDYALADAAKRAGLEPSDASLARAETQRIFYQSRKIPVSMLKDPLARIQPLCVGRLADERLYVTTGLRTYLPSRHAIDKLRSTPFEGYWPSSASEAGPIAERHASEAVPLVFGGTENPMDLPPLPPCSTPPSIPEN